MQINEVKDKVTDYDADDLNPLVDALCDEQESNRSYLDTSDNDISITISIPKHTNLRETKTRTERSVIEPIPAEFITFAARLFIELKNRLIDLAETGSAPNSQSDLIVRQSSRTNSKLAMQLSRSDHAELRKIGHTYNNIFSDSSDMRVPSTFIGDDDARSSVDFGPNFSLLHTRVEDEINHLNLATSTPNWKVFEALNAENDAKNFFCTKMDGDIEDKKMMAHMELTDDESMFYIMTDSEEETFTDREMDNAKIKRPESKRIICQQLKILQLEKDLETVNELQKKIVGITITQNYSNRVFEKAVRSDVIKRDNKSAGDNFNILSNLTDNKCSDVVKVKDDDETEHKRLSLTKNRQSIVLSRNQLLSNITKAQAALQTSKLLSDDSDSLEVDKTSHFDNEPIRAESLKKLSPLKVTAFGESSYMRVPKEATVPIRSKQCTNTHANLVNSDPVSKLDKSGYFRSVATFTENLKEFDDSDSKPMHTRVHELPMSKVLVFDQLNPLNNILLLPNNFSEVHKYNPMKPEEKLWNYEHNRTNDKHYNQACRLGTTRDFEVRTMTIQQHRFMPRSAQEANQGIKYSSYSVDAEELAATTDSTKLSEDSLQNNFSSNNSSIITETKKQIGSPLIDKDKHYCYVDVTPKLQKKSFLKRKKELTSLDKRMGSPVTAKHEKRNSNQNTRTSKVHDKKSPKTKKTKPGQNITVRQLIADCIGLDAGIEHNNDFKEKFFGGNFNAYSQSNMSFSSSKNLNPMKDFLSPPYEECLSPHQPTKESMLYQEYWQPKLPTSKVLVFDYQNSLNNVFISPFNDAEAHRYNPMKSDKTLYCSKLGRSNEKYYNQTTTDFNMRTETCKQHLDVSQVTQKENQRIRLSKLYSADIDTKAFDINDTINTLSNSSHDHFSSNFNFSGKVKKNKKRTYSPTKGKHRHSSFTQVTSKSVKKKPKISTSPKVSRKVKIKVRVKLSSTNDFPNNLEPQKDYKKITKKNTHTPKASDNKSLKPTMTKPERSITVQQLIAEHTGFDTGCKYDDYNNYLNSNLNRKSKSFTAFSHSDVTFTLSKNQNPMKDIVSTLNPDCQSPHQSTEPVMPYQMDWPPELMTITNHSDSGANVVARIDMLPFMGSHECEWETSLADTWSFRLLHGQLRLMARLAHRLDNATRTLVRGDTPVLDIAVKIVRHDKKDLVARTSLRFACETMRHIALRTLRTKCNASDIPSLLQSCANVVRVALRWKRAMHDAKQRLAYTLDRSGNLSLKVANIPLRSVWEVSMRITLVVDNYSSVPWPRATNVRVLPVVSDVTVPIVDVRRSLIRTPKDWGHVPDTIWRVYRLLKYKKRDGNPLR